MSRDFLDTSILIGNWRRQSAGSIESKTDKDARLWAQWLVNFYQTRKISTPVLVEILAGAQPVTSCHSIALTSGSSQ